MTLRLAHLLSLDNVTRMRSTPISVLRVIRIERLAR
jgi:hypothetical protein